MSARQVFNIVAVLASNGTADGKLAVADSSLFWPGAYAILTATGVPDLEVLILSDVPGSANTLRVRALDSKAPYGGSNLAAYTTALTAKLWQPEQVIFDAPGGGVIPRIPAVLKNP